MRRREFINLFGSTLIAWPVAARAQQSTTRIPRVGWLVTGSPTTYRFSLTAFLDGLKAAGRVEGQNVKIEYRWAEGNVARLPELADDLVQQKVDVILAGGSIGAEAAKRATSVIPIVAAGVGDLIELGLVSNLTRPDGNLTGFVANAPEISAKRLQIIKEIKPELGERLFSGIPPTRTLSLNGSLSRSLLRQITLRSHSTMLTTTLTD